MVMPQDVFGLLEHGLALNASAAAIVDEGAPVDYRALYRTVTALAASLQDGGISEGDRVALIERNTPAFLIWTFACAGAGAILVPVNLRLSPAEIAQVLDDADASLVAAHVDFEDLTLASLDRAGVSPRVALLGRGKSACPLGFELSPILGDGFVAAPRAPDDVAHLYYTSGTTGRPKGVPLTHRNVVSHALAATSELDLAADDVWGHIAPMFHLADAWATLAITAVGGTHAFCPEFSPTAALDVISRRGITVTNLVPTMLQRMLHEIQSGAYSYANSDLRLVLSGGAPIAPETVAAILGTFRCEYVQTYGLTETSPYLTLATLDPEQRQLSAERQLALRARTGRAFETVELDVVDERGQSVPRDDRAVGEIVARGSSVTPGYWNRPEETAAAFSDGWFHTGDLATIDRNGSVNIVDRAKDVILSGGENVYSIEVENALYAHPAVLECAAFGVPSAQWGEEVRAAVVLRADATEAELRDHCAALTARYKVPKQIAILPELPKTGSGKIAKRLLRDSAR